MRPARISPTSSAALETSSVVHSIGCRAFARSFADEHRREADANGPERRLAELQREDHFETAIGVDGPDLCRGIAVEHRRKVLARLELLPFDGRKAVCDRDAVVIDDGGVRHVAAIGGGRFENRPDALIGAERHDRVAASAIASRARW